MRKDSKSRRNLQGKPGVRATAIGVHMNQGDPGTPQVLSKIDFSVRRPSLAGIEPRANDAGRYQPGQEDAPPPALPSDGRT